MCSRSPLAFGLVARDLHHYRIMALSYRFLGNYPALLELHWSFSLQILISAVIILIVQSLYTRRIWILSMNRYQRIWSWILVLVLLTGYAGGFFFFVELYRTATFLQLTRIRWLTILGFSFCSLEDFILAITLCVFLSLGRTPFKETKSIVWTIMTYAVISGALTSICSLIFVVTLAVMPNNLREVNVFCQSLYVNSYLAMLNSRKSTMDRIKSSNGPVSMIEFGEFESRHLTIPDPRNRLSSNRRVAEVNTDVVQGGDHDEEGYTDTNPSKSHLR